MNITWEEKARKLEKVLKHKFGDINLLRAAITHRSSGETHNERLEFLGDSVLNFVIAAELYKRFPKAREGDLTRLRAMLVKGETVALVAKDLGVGEYLSLGVGEKKSGGHQRASILADALEAIIGAIFLDAGIHICQERILSWYDNRLNSLALDATQKDPKTRLQEYMQANHLPLPDYQIVEVIGDPHNPSFHVQCKIILLEEPVMGIANSRRKAEQNAAESILKALKNA